jgi:hypothetical protein
MNAGMATAEPTPAQHTKRGTISAQPTITFTLVLILGFGGAPAGATGSGVGKSWLMAGAYQAYCPVTLAKLGGGC